MNKNLIFLILGMFLISFTFVSAENIGTFKQGETFNITNFCHYGGCTGIDLISIQYPNGETKVINQSMTMVGQQGLYEWNDTSEIGIYYFTTTGSNKVTNTDSFEITPNGKVFALSNAVAYIGFIFLTLIILFTTIIGAIKVRWKHERNENGKIITINDFRYIKVFLFSMSYVIAMFLFGLSYKLFNGAGMEGFDSFFNFLYQLFLRLMYPLIVVTVLIFVAIFFSNLKLKKKRALGL